VGGLSAAIAGALRRGPKRGTRPLGMHPEPTPRAVDVTPPRAKRTPREPLEPRAVHPIPLHVLALLLKLQEDWQPGDEILAAEAAPIYVEMCSELWWKPLRWLHKNGVAHHFRVLTGRDPRYRWIVHPDGRRQRLLAYSIPPPGMIEAPSPAPGRRRARPDSRRDSTTGDRSGCDVAA
jgi:hypothetical protein